MVVVVVLLVCWRLLAVGCWCWCWSGARVLGSHGLGVPLEVARHGALFYSETQIPQGTCFTTENCNASERSEFPIQGAALYEETNDGSAHMYVHVRARAVRGAAHRTARSMAREVRRPPRLPPLTTHRTPVHAGGRGCRPDPRRWSRRRAQPAALHRPRRCPWTHTFAHHCAEGGHW